MAGEGRPLFRIIWRNFIDSLKPRQLKGDHIGKDYLGNSYFEIASEKRNGRRASRWFEPAEKDDFEAEVPSEWQSWLRHRRKQPPSEEEISQNLAVSNMKKENAARLEAERVAAGGTPPAAPETGPGAFPAYDEYELGGRPVSFRGQQGQRKLFPEFPTPGKGELK